MGRLVVVALALVPALARADQAEWRIGAGGGVTVIDARAGGVGGTGVGYAARGRLAYGLSNIVELGLVGGYAHASDLEFDSTMLKNQTETLYADVSTFSFGTEVRWTPGVGLARAFERTGPYVAARAGGALVMRTSQQLFTEGGLLIVAPSADLHFAPFAGAGLGVERRFGDHLFLAAELAAWFCVDAREFGLTAEAAWAWY